MSPKRASPRPRHLIVDGLNVIHADAHLAAQWHTDPLLAKESLVSLARSLHDAEGWLVTVVFDGNARSTQCEHPFGGDSFSVIHSPASLSADAVIEQMGTRSSDPSLLTVASNDHMVLDALRASGAETTSAESLLEWIHSTVRTQRERLRRTQDTPNPAWGNRLPL